MNSMVKFLHNEFLERCRKNEQYSLRAFARSLSVPISSLSEIMSEKRPISRKIRDQIGLSMSLHPEEVRKFKVKEHGNKLKIAEESEEGSYEAKVYETNHICRGLTVLIKYPTLIDKLEISYNGELIHTQVNNFNGENKKGLHFALALKSKLIKD